MKYPAKSLLLFLFTCIWIDSVPVQIKAARLPNIVLVMADDMGYECVGANGNTEYKTPNLDRLAHSGIRFENCYSQPLCTPSRVKIMSGKSNAANYMNFEYLSPDEKTFGNLLKDAGYATCIAGKWQLNGLHHNYPGNQDVTRPVHFGFDEYCLWQLHHKRSDGERYANPLLTENGKDLPRNPDAYGPQVMADFICNFIEKNKDRPFFIYYPMLLPHDPFVPAPGSSAWNDASGRYKQDTLHFAGMVAYADKIIGQLDAKLKEAGIWDNTLFIFTADNGTHPSVISATKNGNIRGAKGQSINTGNHVPMIISWPERNPRARVFTGMTDFSDILPTLADVAGVHPSAYTTDGKSLIGVIQGDEKRAAKQEVFIHYAPRWGNFRHNRWVMNVEYKLYQDGMMYNTLQDPLELQPLIKLTRNEKKLKSKFESIIQEKEKEIPFELNDKEYSILLRNKTK